MPIKTAKVKIGGKRIKVRALTLKRLLGLIILMSPYIVLVEDKWPEIKLALAHKERGMLLSVLFRELREPMAEFPADIAKALAILIGKDPVWVAQNATPEELLKAIPILDNVNDFKGVYTVIEILGFKDA